MIVERIIAIIVAFGFLVGIHCQQHGEPETSSLLQLRQLVSSQQPQRIRPKTTSSVRTLAAATVTSGYYVLNVFSDSGCSSYVSQQTFLLNVCYSSSTSGQYNIGVLQVDSTSFSSFTVKSSTSLTSCTSLVASGTNTPSSSYVGESCALLSTGFYYKSTWSAFPSTVPPTSTSSSAFPNGYIIKEYDDDGSCALTLPRTTTFFASSSSCIPYRSVMNSVATIYYVTGSCASSALTLLKYTDSSCATLLRYKNNFLFSISILSLVNTSPIPLCLTFPYLSSDASQYS